MDKITIEKSLFTPEAWERFKRYLNSVEEFILPNDYLKPFYPKISLFLISSINEFLQEKNARKINGEVLHELLTLYGTPSEFLLFLGFVFYCPICSIRNPIGSLRCVNCKIHLKLSSKAKRDHLIYGQNTRKSHFLNVFILLFLSILSLFPVYIMFDLSTGTVLFFDTLKFFFSIFFIPLISFSISKTISSLFPRKETIYYIPYVKQLDYKLLLLSNILIYSSSLFLIQFNISFTGLLLKTIITLLNILLIYLYTTCLLIAGFKTFIPSSNIINLAFLKKIRKLSKSLLYQVPLNQLNLMCFLYYLFTLALFFFTQPYSTFHMFNWVSLLVYPAILCFLIFECYRFSYYIKRRFFIY